MVREYVFSPLTRTASSNKSSSITTFVRFIHILYQEWPDGWLVIAKKKSERDSYNTSRHAHTRSER
jgi:hypothetical protein